MSPSIAIKRHDGDLPAGAKTDEADEQHWPDPEHNSLSTDLSTKDDSGDLGEPGQDIKSSLDTSLGSRVGDSDLGIDDSVVPVDDRVSGPTEHKDTKSG